MRKDFQFDREILAYNLKR